MVAMVRPSAYASSAANTATNIVRRAPPRADRARVHEAREQPRTQVTYKAWLCAESFSARGFVLDLSNDGARLGGVGFRFTPGERVILKVVADDAQPPVVLKAEVVRADPVCVRFVDDGRPIDADVAQLLAQVH
jgi:hypothetical protein